MKFVHNQTSNTIYILLHNQINDLLLKSKKSLFEASKNEQGLYVFRHEKGKSPDYESDI